MSEYPLQEAADIMGVPANTVRDWCRRGDIPARAVQYGTRTYWYIPAGVVENVKHKGRTAYGLSAARGKEVESQIPA